MSHSRGVGDAKEVGTRGGNSSSAVNGVGRGGISKKDCSAPLNCCTGDGKTEEDADLDDRIRHALDQLESPSHQRKGFAGSNGYMLDATRTTSIPPELGVVGGGASEESDSDSDGEEESPSDMGYMPLPQDPDAEEESTWGCLATSDVGDQMGSRDQEDGQQQREDKDQVQEVVSDAVPEAASVDLKKGIVTCTFFV